MYNIHLWSLEGFRSRIINIVDNEAGNVTDNINIKEDAMLIY